jgi:hypothetical protein
MPIIEGYTEALRHTWEECRLRVIEGLWDDAEVEKFDGKDVVQEAPGGAPFVGE